MMNQEKLGVNKQKETENKRKMQDDLGVNR